MDFPDTLLFGFDCIVFPNSESLNNFRFDTHKENLFDWSEWVKKSK